MIRFLCAAVVLLAVMGYATAEWTFGKYVEAKDGKITIHMLGKGDDLNRTHPIADKYEVRTGKVFHADARWHLEEGDLIKDGLKSDTFSKEHVDKGFYVALVFDDAGKVIKVVVLSGRKKDIE
jgi:hypothetical protein